MHHPLLLLLRQRPGRAHHQINLPFLLLPTFFQEARLPLDRITGIIHNFVVVAGVFSDVELGEDEGVDLFVGFVADEAEGLEGGRAEGYLLFYLAEGFILEEEFGAQGGDLGGGVLEG